MHTCIQISFMKHVLCTQTRYYERRSGCVFVGDPDSTNGTSAYTNTRMRVHTYSNIYDKMRKPSRYFEMRSGQVFVGDLGSTNATSTCIHTYMHTYIHTYRYMTMFTKQVIRKEVLTSL